MDDSEKETAVPSENHAVYGDKDETRDNRATVDTPNQSVTNLLGEKSPGVQRIEALSAHFTLYDRILFFLGIFLIAYAYGLDGTIRIIYQVCMSATVAPPLYHKRNID